MSKIKSVDREISMNWWNALDYHTKFFHAINFLSNGGRDTAEVHPSILTGREIQEIYKSINK